MESEYVKNYQRCVTSFINEFLYDEIQMNEQFSLRDDIFWGRHKGDEKNYVTVQKTYLWKYLWK